MFILMGQSTQAAEAFDPITSTEGGTAGEVKPLVDNRNHIGIVSLQSLGGNCMMEPIALQLHLKFLGKVIIGDVAFIHLHPFNRFHDGFDGAGW